MMQVNEVNECEIPLTLTDGELYQHTSRVAREVCPIAWSGWAGLQSPAHPDHAIGGYLVQHSSTERSTLQRDISNQICC